MQDSAPHSTRRPSSSAQELIAHILEAHHEYLRANLPRISATFEGLPSETQKTLAPASETFQAIRTELEQHMLKEELVLFPAIQELEAAAHQGRTPQIMGCGLEGPIGQMQYEHRGALELLERLRAYENGGAEVQGTAPVRELVGLLKGFRENTEKHIRLEEEELFPLAFQLQERAPH